MVCSVILLGALNWNGGCPNQKILIHTSKDEQRRNIPFLNRRETLKRNVPVDREEIHFSLNEKRNISLLKKKRNIYFNMGSQGP